MCLRKEKHMKETLTDEEKKNNIKIAKRNLRWFVIGLIGIGIMIIVASPSSNSNVSKDDYEIVSTQSYIRDGQECMGYRVYVKESCKEYESIAYEVTKDGYYQHTVWFYHSKKDADGSGIAFKTIER